MSAERGIIQANHYSTINLTKPMKITEAHLEALDSILTKIRIHSKRRNTAPETFHLNLQTNLKGIDLTKLLEIKEDLPNIKKKILSQ